MLRREVLEAELAKRKAQPQQSRREALEAELAKRKAQPQQEADIYEMPYVGKPLSALTGFEKAMAGPAAGLLQIMGANDLANSVHNYWEKAYEKSKQANPYTSMTGYGAGIVTPSIAIPFGGSAGLLGRTAAGAGIGGAQGALNYVPENESRLTNALIGAGSGMLGANILPAITGTGKFISSVYKAFPGGGKEALANEIAIKGKNAVENKARTLYEGLRNTAKEKGAEIRNTKNVFPESEVEKITNRLTPNEKSVFQDFLNKDKLSFEDAHDLYKFLGKSERNIKNSASKLQATPRKTLEAFSNLKTRVNNAMKLSLAEHGIPEQIGKLEEANKYYLESVLPYHNKLIDRYLGKIPGKKLTAEGFLKRISNDEDFMSTLGHQYPNQIFRETLPKKLKNIGIGGGGLIGLEELLRHSLR